MNTQSVKWRDIGDGGVKCVHDEGDFDGALVTVASVVQGGNGLWTPYVFQTTKGRKKKIGQGRIAGKTATSYWPGQQKTREEAIALCERKWHELLSPNADFREPPR
jgi:hypothetical protein